MSIAEQVAALLEEAWNKPQQKPEDVWFYQRVLGTKFVEFIGNMEKALRTLVGRLKVVEAQQLKIFEALNIAPSAPAQAQQGASPSSSQPQAQSAPRTRAPAGLVRLDSMGNEMSPEDQEAEERADMMTDGAIDRTRYVPRGSAPPPQMTQPTQPSAPPPLTPAEVAGATSAVNPNGQS